MNAILIRAIFLVAIGLAGSYSSAYDLDFEEMVRQQNILQEIEKAEVSASLNGNDGKVIRVPESLRASRILSIFNQSFNELLTSRYRWAQSPSGIRSRRSLILPGTNYCGIGNDTTDITSVGDMSGPNRCCREHDTCPFTIQGFQTKYNMYNFRFYTISHCECDDIFRTCLRMANTDQSNLVGRLYFNYIGMKCFVFKRETVCAEREWWGRCKRERVQITADLRDPLQW